MSLRKRPIRIGLRTIKSVVAVVIAMALVDVYGTGTSKLTFAMLGAMAAMQPTIRDSVESCLTQIVGVLFGAMVGLLLMRLPIPMLAIVAIGIVLVITLYNALNIRFSANLPCMIVLTLCTSEGVTPFSYATERIWDTAIGLAVGLLINLLVCPYDNRRRIRKTARSLEQELLSFLEELLDNDGVFPNADNMHRKIRELEAQLKIFKGQKVPMKLQGNYGELARFERCEEKAQQLISHMVVLCEMKELGRVDPQTGRLLQDCGIFVAQVPENEPLSRADVVTNYHITELLRLRTELLEILRR